MRESSRHTWINGLLLILHQPRTGTRGSLEPRLRWNQSSRKEATKRIREAMIQPLPNPRKHPINLQICLSLRLSPPNQTSPIVISQKERKKNQMTRVRQTRRSGTNSRDSSRASSLPKIRGHNRMKTLQVRPRRRERQQPLSITWSFESLLLSYYTLNFKSLLSANLL